jgi:SH3-like domain-containing protein
MSPFARLGKWGLPAALLCALFSPVAAQVAAESARAASGLPLPRFVSLKTDKVNIRGGPSREHEVTWVFTRVGLPVEIMAESENWRRIRDAEGAEGWVYHSLLSGRRTVLIAPWSKNESFALYERADKSAGVTANLQPGVLATVKNCNGKWCRIFGDGFDGYMEQERLWGVYPSESIE